MLSAELVIDYTVLEKPFRLVERHAHCGGTEYATICRLRQEDAELLAASGISWLYGEPDWNKHFHQMEMLKAKRDKAEAERRIAELTEVKP